jgi:hypothetical protein
VSPSDVGSARPTRLALLALLLGACGDNTAAVPAAPDARAFGTVDAAADMPAWSLVVMPDTQGYAGQYPDIFTAQTRWIAEHAEELRIQYVLHVGDVTDWNSDVEWQRARRAFDELGDVPLAVVPGNHDYYTDRVRDSRLTEFVPVAEVSALPGFAGLFEPERTDNSAHRFEVDGEKWLIVGLEWGPRDEVLTWAGAVIDAHPDHRAIVLTHAYLFLDDTRYDWAGRAADQPWNPHSYPATRWPDVNDGEEIWRRVVNERDNVRLVVCGHAAEEGVGRLASTTRTGARVDQLRANYQGYEMGGAGYLRILTFFGDRIEVRTYSPWLDAEYEDADNRFVLPRD